MELLYQWACLQTDEGGFKSSHTSHSKQNHIIRYHVTKTPQLNKNLHHGKEEFSYKHSEALL